MEGSKRAPSNDVLSFKMTIEGSLTRDEAQAGLQEALKGHSYAWTYKCEEAAQIHVVMVAAGSERDEKGRLERIYANDRSIHGLHDRFEARFGGWPSDFGEPRWDHGVEGATTALARLTRGGEIDAFTPDGERFVTKRFGCGGRDRARRVVRRPRPSIRASRSREAGKRKCAPEVRGISRM